MFIWEIQHRFIKSLSRFFKLYFFFCELVSQAAELGKVEKHEAATVSHLKAGVCQCFGYRKHADRGTWQKQRKNFNIPHQKVYLFPSIHFLYPFNPSVGSRGGWSLSQRSLGERQGTPWTGRQSITGPHRTKRDKQPLTRSHSLLRTISETPINLTCMFLDGERKPEYPERSVFIYFCNYLVKTSFIAKPNSFWNWTNWIDIRSHWIELQPNELDLSHLRKSVAILFICQTGWSLY